MSELKIETSQKVLVIQDPAPGIQITPPIDEDFWLWRVPLTGKQAIVAFPKFGTFGIGFQNEEDWNTNLPYTCKAEKIYEHIKHNKGKNSISRDACIKAIRMIQEAITLSRNPKRRI